MTYPKYNCQKLHRLYQKLLYELNRIDIHNIDDYLRYKEAGNYFVDKELLEGIEWDFVRNCKSIMEKLPYKINSQNGLSILVDEKMPHLTENHQKKILVFSRDSYLVADGIDVCDFDAEGDETDSVYFWEGPNIGGCLKLAYNYKSEVNKGIINPIPDYIRYVEADEFDAAYKKAWDDKEFVKENAFLDPYSSDHEERYFARFKAAANVSTIAHDLPRSAFVLSINDQALGMNHDLMKIGFVLPSLQSVPIKTVRKIRTDYEDEFIKFQYTLMDLSEKFKNESDEKRFINILREVEENVNNINKLYARINKVHKSISIVTGLICIVFYLAVSDHKLLNHLHSIFSGIGSIAFYEYFRDYRDTKHEVENSPFYFPLIVAKNFHQLKRK